MENMRKTTQATVNPNGGPKLSFLQEINREAESIIQRSILGDQDDSDTYEPKVVPMRVDRLDSTSLRESTELKNKKRGSQGNISPRSQRPPKLMEKTRTTIKPKNSLS